MVVRRQLVPKVALFFVQMLDGSDLRSLVKCVLLCVRVFLPRHAVDIRVSRTASIETTT